MQFTTTTTAVSGGATFCGFFWLDSKTGVRKKKKIFDLSFRKFALLATIKVVLAGVNAGL